MTSSTRQLLEFIKTQLDREYKDLDYNLGRANYFSEAAATNDATIIALEKMETQYETTESVKTIEPQELPTWGKARKSQEHDKETNARRHTPLGAA